MSQTQLVSWKPRSFQATGVKLGLSQACLGLLYPPGGGKTSVMYMIFRILKDKGFVKKMLVICPIRPMYNVWPEQKNKFEEFAHLRVAILHGPDKQAALESDADIYVVNPEGLPWLFDKARQHLVKNRMEMLCVDESTKFKNPQSQRFKILKPIVKWFRRRYILTGTIAPRGLLDLFGQIYLLDEGQALGRYITHYRNEFFMPSGYGGFDYQLQPGGEVRIVERIAPLVLRVELEDMGLDLPELMFDDIWVTLPPSARTLYDAMHNEMMALLEGGDLVAANAAVASSKCRQIANGAVFDTEVQGKWHLVHAEKLKALEDLIEQLQGESLLITYEFTFDRENISKLLKDKVWWISSGNARKDNEGIDLFSRGLISTVMGQPQSIALGIDGLQDNCHHIAMMGCTWNLQDYLQVIDRVRRQGSKAKRVIVHRILATGTVDARVLKVLDNRESTQADFMRALKDERQ